MCQHDCLHLCMFSMNTLNSVNICSHTSSSLILLNARFTTRAARRLSFHPGGSSLAVYGIWHKSSTKLTNILLLSSVKCYFISLCTSSAEVWSPLRITYTTWLSCDKVMNYQSFQKHLFCSYSFLSLWLQQVCYNDFTVCLSLFTFCLFTFTNWWGTVISLE